MGYTTQKTEARAEAKGGNAERPERETKSPVKAVLIQANIRQVPAHVRLTNDCVGLTDQKDFRPDISPDGIRTIIIVYNSYMVWKKYLVSTIMCAEIKPRLLVDDTR